MWLCTPEAEGAVSAAAREVSDVTGAGASFIFPVMTKWSADYAKASGNKVNAKALAAWWQQIAQWRKKDCLKYDRNAKTIKPRFVVEKLWEVTKGDAIVTSDVGQHQMFAAQFYKFDRPRRWINSGGLGTMGYGFPSAMGVQIAHPKELVVCVTGEASFMMNIQELSTVKQYRLPVKIFILNNRYMGMVRQWQEMFHGCRYAESYMDSLPDFVKLAEAYGMTGLRCDKVEEVDAAIEAMITTKGPVILDMVVDQNENVYPMIPAGAAHYELVLGPEENTGEIKTGDLL